MQVLPRSMVTMAPTLMAATIAQWASSAQWVPELPVLALQAHLVMTSRWIDIVICARPVNTLLRVRALLVLKTITALLESSTP